MLFKVRWKRGAKSDSAEIWLNSHDRAAVTKASHHVDDLLSHNPLKLGESRDGVRRILMVPPLAIYYEVILDDLKVNVLSVRGINRTE